MSALRKLVTVVVLATALFAATFGASFLTMKLAFDRDDEPAQLRPCAANESCVG